jgi:predicted proteasome-type protease
LKEFEGFCYFCLVHSWRLTANRTEERDEEEEKKKKASLGEMASAHMSRSMMGPTAREIMRKSQVHLSHSLFNLNSVFICVNLVHITGMRL